MRSFFFENLWRWKCGLKEIELNEKTRRHVSEVFKTNWSSLFIKLMRNRLAMGFFRYGPLHKQEKGKYNNIKSIRQRLDLYEKTGNDEILVDVANISMVEFLNGVHPKKHFKAIDDGIHTEANW